MNKSPKKSDNGVKDRRVQKTKQLLSEALVELILEKGYEEVSVADILDRANVGRSTFYAHYENKGQLLLFGHEHLRNLAIKEGAKEIDFVSFYQHLSDRHRLAERLLTGSESAGIVTRSLHDILLVGIARLFAAPHRSSSETAMQRLLCEAAAAALVQLMTAWIRGGMPNSPAIMATESTALMQRMLKIP